jgi:hypothetical protein
MTAQIKGPAGTSGMPSLEASLSGVSASSKINHGPRHLRRSVARANMERQGIKPTNKAFSKYGTTFRSVWRKFAYIPSPQELTKALLQKQKDTKRRRRDREKAKR